MIQFGKIWLVNEANPRPDSYIAVLVGEGELFTQTRPREYKMYRSARKAMDRAAALRKKYGVKQIRLFYPSGVSLIVKDPGGRDRR